MVLYLTRTWHGNGGMQRLSRELADAGFQTIHPERPGIMGLVGFCMRALVAARNAEKVHLGDATLLPLGRLILFFGGPVPTVSAHGLDIIYPARWYQWMLLRFLPTAKKVLCHSHATMERVKERGVPADRIVLVPCGTREVDVFVAPRNACPVIIAIGRLIPRKGLAWFIDHVLPQVGKVRFVIVGNGPELSKIQTIMRTRKLESVIELHTHADDRERDQLLAQADLLVVPNVPVAHDMEGFGITCIEAAMRGVPVVAARLEGLTDAVIEGETGKFFQPQEAVDCARVIQVMLAHPLDRAGISHAAKQKYAWNNVLPLYAAVFAS